MSHTPVRLTQMLNLTLPAEDIAEAKAKAAKLGMTVSGYFSSLMRAPLQPAPRPAVDWMIPAQISTFVAQALAVALAKGDTAISEPLQRAKHLLFEEMVKHTESYERDVDDQQAEDDTGHSIT